MSDPYSGVNIGPPNDDLIGLNRRIQEIEGLLSALRAYDATVKLDQGATRMTIMGREIGEGELGEAAISAAFYSLILENEITYLQGGTVTGGSGTVTVAKIALTQLVGSEIEPVATAGHHLWLEITGNGYEEDGLLLPGFDVTAAITATGAAVPANTLPVSGSVSAKKTHVSLGVFTESGFLPASVGNIQVSFCPGSYNTTRS